MNDFHQFYQSVLVLYESRGWPPDAGEFGVDDKLSVVLLTTDATTTTPTPTPPSLADDVLLNYSDDDNDAGGVSPDEDDVQDVIRTRNVKKSSQHNISMEDPPPPTKRKRGRPRKSEQHVSEPLVQIESIKDEPPSNTSDLNQCCDCSKTYTSAKRLDSHRRLKHAAVDAEAASSVGPEKLPNDTGNRTEPQRNDEELLHRYMRMACNECGVPFATFADAKRHQEQAHDRYGYVECCDRKFSTKGRAVQHCLWHENPHQFE